MDKHDNWLVEGYAVKLDQCYECANNKVPRTVDVGLGINVLRCPEEEVEDLCKDTPSTPVSVQFPGED